MIKNRGIIQASPANEMYEILDRDSFNIQILKFIDIKELRQYKIDASLKYSIS